MTIKERLEKARSEIVHAKFQDEKFGDGKFSGHFDPLIAKVDWVLKDPCATKFDRGTFAIYIVELYNYMRHNGATHNTVRHLRRALESLLA